MARKYTRSRTPVKTLNDDGHGIVTIDAREKFKRSMAFEWRGERIEILGADVDTAEEDGV